MLLTAEKLGSEGVGVAWASGKPIIVPGLLPGEQARVSVTGGKGRLLERFSDSADRIAPLCTHFGRCGGCAVQHLNPTAYRDFKRRLIGDALRRHGLGDVEVNDPLISPPGTRRRTVFEAIRHGGAIRLGYHIGGSHELIDLAECPVLEPALVALIVPLRSFLKICLNPGDAASITLTMTDGGIDLGLGLPRAPDLSVLEELAAFAVAQDLARLWWRSADAPPVPAILRRQPVLHWPGIDLEPPMGGFLQATTAGETALRDLVVEAVAPVSAAPRKILDLFAGAGTFALPLAARGAAVHAVEQDAEALAALTQAARKGRLLQVTTERRNLEERPVETAALSRFDAVILDPPRAGAASQSAQLAQAKCRMIVSVSCNPATFARDAAALVAGGWKLDRVTPVDQFLWSSHIELVGTFSR